MASKITEFNDFQKAFFQWFIPKKKCLLQAPPGSGKSLCMVGFYALLHRKYDDLGRMLVITESKAMGAIDKANIWHYLVTKVKGQSDLNIFYPGATYPSDIYCITSRCLVKIMDDDYKRREFFKFLQGISLLCEDEVHQFRVYKSAITKALRQATDFYNKLVDKEPGSKRHLAVTATPVYKNLLDWHPLMAIVEPNLFPNFFQFQDRYCIIQERNTYTSRRMFTGNGTSSYKQSFGFKEVIGFKNTEELYKKLEPYVFEYNNSEFTFHYDCVNYVLDEEEKAKYKQALSGLGLDKAYTILLETKDGPRYIYRDKTDILFDLLGHEMQVRNLSVGAGIKYDGEACRIGAIYTRETDTNYTTRLVQAQQENSTAKDKLEKLYQYIQKINSGCIVYFNYHYSVNAVYRYLASKRLGRRIVILTGETQNLSKLVDTLSTEDIALVTRAASQSLDFKVAHMALYEVPSNPGSLSQLQGRMSRTNNPFRDCYVTLFVRTGSVEEYIQERLALHIRAGAHDITAKDFPRGTTLAGIPDDEITVKLLKEELLWAEVKGDSRKRPRVVKAKKQNPVKEA